MRCPTCEREFDASQSSALPFCSPRCRDVDLGRWLGERHSLPLPPSDDEEQEFSAPENGRDD